MKTQWGLLTSIACAGIGLTVWGVGTTSSAMADSNVLTAAGIVASTPIAADEAAFVGSKKCKKCHMAHTKSWKKTTMGTALDTLKPGKNAEAKTKHGLDPEKDYTTDASCLKCHTTGYGKDGGYTVPDAADKKSVKKAKALAGVGCESCHGAGGNYIKLHEEIMKSKRTYTLEEMYASGLTKISADTCTACHNDTGPTFEAFDYDKQKDEGIHEHKAPKQRVN